MSLFIKNILLMLLVSGILQVFGTVENYFDYSPSELVKDQNTDKLEAVLKNRPERISTAWDKNLNSLLHYAVEQEQIQAIKILLTYKANVNYSNKYGDTPLHIVAYNGNLKILQMLISTSEIDLEVKNLKKETPLFIATKNNHLYIVNELIANKSNINTQNYQGKTPLYKAILREHYTLVQALVFAGADLLDQLKLKNSPFMLIAKKRDHLALEIVMKHKNALEALKQNDGNNKSLFYHLLRANKKEFIFILNKAGVDLNQKMENGMSPITFASKYYLSETLSALLELSIDPNKKDQNGKSAFDYAQKYKNKTAESLKVYNLLKNHSVNRKIATD